MRLLLGSGQRRAALSWVKTRGGGGRGESSAVSRGGGGEGEGKGGRPPYLADELEDAADGRLLGREGRSQ